MAPVADDGCVSETSSSTDAGATGAGLPLPEPRSEAAASAEGLRDHPGTWEAFVAKPAQNDGASGDASSSEADLAATDPETGSAAGFMGLLRKHRTLVASGAVVLLGAMSLLVALGIVMARSAPSWWVDVDKDSARNRQLSQMVQNGTLTHITADRGTLIGGSVEWPVMMTDEAANAWLNIGLPDWFSKITDGMAWPESVTQIQIVFDSGIIRIGVRATTESGSRIYSCAIRPELHEDGSLWMQARTVSMGKLTLPASWVLRGADAHAAEYIPEQLRGTAQAEALFEKLTGKLPLFEQAEVDLSDGRIVRLTDLRVRDGTVIALCVTEIPE